MRFGGRRDGGGKFSVRDTVRGKEEGESGVGCNIDMGDDKQEKQG